MDEQKVSKASPAVSQRLIICGIVLVVGIVGMVALAGMKAPPAESEFKERPCVSRSDPWPRKMSR